MERAERLEDRVDRIESGFVNRDPEGHRRYHETVIEDLEERRRLRKAVQEKTISGLVWAAMLAIGSACWAYLKAMLKGAG